MLERKTIAVVGATGAQGGGLVRAILNDPSSGFIPRAINLQGVARAKQEPHSVAVETESVPTAKRSPLVQFSERPVFAELASDTR
jgi:hypothetical protein